MMRLAMMMVEQFQRKMRFATRSRLKRPSEVDSNASHFLRREGQGLILYAKNMLHTYERGGGSDERLLRAHLMLEELGETLVALAECDEEGVLDGLADLTYVVLGTAVTLDLPLVAMFMEVHASNMTKTRREGDARVRDKGASYVKASPAAVLAHYREHREALDRLSPDRATDAYADLYEDLGGDEDTVGDE